MEKLKERFFALPTGIQAIVLTLFIIMIYGLAGPSMISSNSTIAVWVGIAICLGSAYLIWIFTEKLRELFK